MVFGHFKFVWPLLLPYVLLNLCHKLPFHSLGRVGDFSYGAYLYAFPIQQCLYAFGVHEQGLAFYFVAAVVLSVAFGVLSWFLVERPAIRVGNALVRFVSTSRARAAAAPAAPAPLVPGTVG